MVTFYCQKICGDVEFSIEEWNKQFKICDDLGIEMPPEPDPCKQQCFDCLAIIGKTKDKNSKLPPLKLTND